MKGAVFDWDGTLVDIDQREFHCINKALAEHGEGEVSQEFYVHNYYQRPFEVGSGPRMVIETALAQNTGRADRVYETSRRRAPTLEAPERGRLEGWHCYDEVYSFSIGFRNPSLGSGLLDEHFLDEGRPRVRQEARFLGGDRGSTGATSNQSACQARC